MSNTVLKIVTKGDIQAARDEAQQQYLNRVEGFDVDYQGRPDASGNLPRRWFKGAVVEFVASTGPDELLDIVLKKIGEGWTRSTTATTSIGAAYFNVYLMKPTAQQQEDLKGLYAEAEAKLRAKVEVENEAIIERQVELRIANAARLKAEQLAKEAQEEAAAIREEVERALGATRAAVRASLGAK
ncbi:hypothetical protein [Pseudomonas putida]|jgi:hypothetical protein|uniref:hypothetical protein n=1 Tax=Pseudomonas putida TaxID=303 RepID=UPI0023632B7A|nr:hypothetical protein [Pseudomonas putida]MDD2098827.1 hypothetical protein [Pseudomonas putida]